MYYKADNVDTDKALEAIKDARRYWEQATQVEIQKARSFLDGLNKGLDIADGIFECENYEKNREPSYMDGAKDIIYEIGKELDIPTQDIRDNITSVDEAAAEMANRIQGRMNGEETKN